MLFCFKHSTVRQKKRYKVNTYWNMSRYWIWYLLGNLCQWNGQFLSTRTTIGGTRYPGCASFWTWYRFGCIGRWLFVSIFGFSLDVPKCCTYLYFKYVYILHWKVREIQLLINILHLILTIILQIKKWYCNSRT